MRQLLEGLLSVVEAIACIWLALCIDALLEPEREVIPCEECEWNRDGLCYQWILDRWDWDADAIEENFDPDPLDPSGGCDRGDRMRDNRPLIDFLIDFWLRRRDEGAD